MLPTPTSTVFPFRPSFGVPDKTSVPLDMLLSGGKTISVPDVSFMQIDMCVYISGGYACVCVYDLKCIANFWKSGEYCSYKWRAKKDKVLIIFAFLEPDTPGLALVSSSSWAARLLFTEHLLCAGNVLKLFIRSASSSDCHLADEEMFVT